jgi:hypothetical protein
MPYKWPKSLLLLEILGNFEEEERSARCPQRVRSEPHCRPLLPGRMEVLVQLVGSSMGGD